MRILIIGSGGREHALAWKIRQNPNVSALFIAPGNGGTASEGENVPLADSDIPAIMAFIKENAIDFVVPGPELPLVLGIADACKAAGVPCFGPSQYAAQLEGSKSFSKNIMRESGVPTADFAVFTNPVEAKAYIEKHGAPVVVKADGLAAGKGVVVAKTVAEALAAVDDMMVKKIFGAAGETVVVEDTLVGEEVSFLCICDDETVIPLPSAQDHKAAYDGDTGPNTGGMGAYSPAPILPETDYAAMANKVIRPILRTLKKHGHPFRGILYAGLMMTKTGPMVLEYNVRFGDPECQPLLMRLEGDLLEVMKACTEGRLDTVTLTHKAETAICVVIAAEAYPGAYETGMPITGLDAAEAVAPGMAKVFQAGTAVTDGKLVAKGGRILGVTALGATLRDAQKTAYAAAAKVAMAKSRYRKDIGDKALR
ncbi:Phosphoribosylamine--glycine ligase [uncultured delta proteobacterium]|uniref:Phosphoribosylamine--glycine ligase n=1 Tax=uncultured delta proteobacterium TaxID=34034 RepID=A0A212KD55_9DELT|nr:Phosphoribosylamine--glycine ligase [uncultured delta proteobacterium]